MQNHENDYESKYHIWFDVWTGVQPLLYKSVHITKQIYVYVHGIISGIDIQHIKRSNQSSCCVFAFSGKLHL